MPQTTHTGQMALFLGAGFSKEWGLPLNNEIMEQQLSRSRLPAKWQVALFDKVYAVWGKSHKIHQGKIDEFIKQLQPGGRLFGNDYKLSFDDVTKFMALRLSAEHWHIGGARATKMGTGDHVRKQKKIPVAYQQFVKALKNKSITGIITTNYDLVIEKLLGPRTTGRLGGFNYGKKEEKLEKRHHTSSKYYYGPVTITGKIPFLKLHGSLNWAVSPEGIFLKYVDARPSRVRNFSVLIDPPAKSASNDLLQPIWQQAKNVLETSDIWVFCGYSFPEYDQDVRKLLKSSVGRFKTVVILDPNAQPILHRLKKFFSNVDANVEFRCGPGITSELNTGDISPLLRVQTR